MARSRRKKQSVKPKPQPESLKAWQPLKAWQQVSEFLGQPISVAQRWAKTGMPLKAANFVLAMFLTFYPAFSQVCKAQTRTFPAQSH